ncbi:AT-hook DNA-binding family protein, putative [Medicago truncatula]|uniref:AT-hook motif nuclear-localized protein n=1 Tax=Medicago truncatula TaxID=3880 RepID=A0A072UKJ8_MEDTR|nr:AT-hook DNA-binding family protein, putative [Medicago truncatula]
MKLIFVTGGCVGETARGSMSPHVLIVKPGEDVVGKIFAFYQKGPSSAVCILSATGTISSVTIRQPSASDGFLTYEGHFEILSLSGSCTFTTGAQRKIGMLSVSLAKPNGEVFGGGVENTLIAATPTQLILATFKQTISNQIKRKDSSLPSTAANMLTNQDSAKENNSKVPKLTTEGGPSCLTPTTTNTNGVIVEDNVTIVADENVQSDSIVIDLDSQTPEPVKGEPSCLTATTTDTNGVIVEDNVTIVADENVQSADSIVIDLDIQIPEPVKISPDFDANHVPEE